MDAPDWKKPSDVMKIHRRRKSVSQRRITTEADKRTSIIYKSPSKSVKRKNPFYKDSPHPFPAKRQQIEFKENQPDGHDPLSCQLFNILDSVNENGSVSRSSPTADATPVLQAKQYSDMQQQDDPKHDKTKKIDKLDRPSKEKVENNVSPFLPVDWSLKTKLRVVSSRPLDWCTQLKSADEAHGVKDFVCHSFSKGDTETERRQQFHADCMYWIHPSLPWMKLFPRIIDDTKSSLSVSYLLQEEAQRNLQADWAQSFTSAYHQLRSGLCPYFYVCTHQFTVLFCNKCGDQSGVIAMVTPTTRGFRESLENEGIEFKLPVGNKLSSPSRKEDTVGPADGSTMENKQEEGEDGLKERVDNEGDDILEADDAAHTWLESMGLDKKQFPSLDPKKVKLQREGFRVIDHRPESLVLIEGSEVQAFFNFLLNCRTCVAMSGVQAGLPPTILSPEAFKGATLKSLKVKHTVVKQSDRDDNVTQAHIVEVAGPILPRHCQSLVTLLHHTQKADFGMVFNNQDSTIPFNVLSQLVQDGSSNLNNSNSNIDARNLSKTDSKTHVEEDSPNKMEIKSAVGISKDMSHVTRRSVGNDSRCNTSTILDTITETEEDDTLTDKVEQKCDQLNSHKGFQISGLHSLVPIDNDRLNAIKEVVCTPNGFTWTS